MLVRAKFQAYSLFALPEHVVEVLRLLEQDIDVSASFLGTVSTTSSVQRRHEQVIATERQVATEAS